MKLLLLMLVAAVGPTNQPPPKTTNQVSITISNKLERVKRQREQWDERSPAKKP